MELSLCTKRDVLLKSHITTDKTRVILFISDSRFKIILDYTFLIYKLNKGLRPHKSLKPSKQMYVQKLLSYNILRLGVITTSEYQKKSLIFC